jgi:hypothetical protein
MWWIVLLEGTCLCVWCGVALRSCKMLFCRICHRLTSDKWNMEREREREREAANVVSCSGNGAFIPPVERVSYGVLLPLESAAMLTVDFFPIRLTKYHVTNQFLLSCHVTTSIQINYTAFQIFSSTFEAPSVCPSSLPFVFVTRRTKFVFLGLSHAVCWSCPDVSMYLAVAVSRVNRTSTQGTRSRERSSVYVSDFDDADVPVKARRLWLVQRLRQACAASCDEKGQFV